MQNNAANQSLEMVEVPRKARGGRPTKAEAVKRDERLLDIATTMFMTHGFEATSMDRLAEMAAVGKATLYARYADKGMLFADVVRRRILQVYAPIETEIRDTLYDADLEATLDRLAARLIEKSMSPESIALGRIIAAQGIRFPTLAKLLVEEGVGRQLQLVGTVLTHFVAKDALVVDVALAADLFLALVLGRSSRLAIYGVAIDPEALACRTKAAVGVFTKALRAGFLEMA